MSKINAVLVIPRGLERGGGKGSETERVMAKKGKRRICGQGQSTVFLWGHDEVAVTLSGRFYGCVRLRLQNS